MYNVTNRRSYESIKYWKNEFETNARQFDTSLPVKPVLVLGNKKDLGESVKQVSSDELQKFGKENGVIVKEVSAKKNANKEVQGAINELINLLTALGKWGLKTFGFGVFDVYYTFISYVQGT